MKVHFALNDNGDWMRVYLGGRLIYEGHGDDTIDMVSRLLGADNVTLSYHVMEDPFWEDNSGEQPIASEAA